MQSEGDHIFLKGKTIISTYPKKIPDVLADSLESLGAKVLSLPMIQISPIPFSLEKNIEQYNWIVFTSKNAIPPFFKKIQLSNQNKIAVIGKGTADELSKHEYQASFIGSGKSGEDFAEELVQLVPEGESILLVLGQLAPNTIQQKLSSKNSVDRIDVYNTEMPDSIQSEHLQRIEKDDYDLIIVSSPSAIINLSSALKNGVKELRLISIGKTTSAAIRKLGIEPLAEAKESSYQGLADITIEYLKNQNTRR